MTVVGVAADLPRDWRWRIVNHAGEVVRESSATFQTLAAALAQGKRELVEMNVVDLSMPVSHFRRSTSHLRQRGR